MISNPKSFSDTEHAAIQTQISTYHRRIAILQTYWEAKTQQAN